METIVLNRVIMIKYGELSTKKSNRKLFIKALYNDLKNKLREYPVTMTSDISRMYISFNDQDLDNVLKKINLTFGIHAYVVAYKIVSEQEVIEKTLINLLDTLNFKTFKVETKRSDKNFPIPSTEFSSLMGSLILKNKDHIKVDIHHPEVVFNIEIRKDYTYIYLNQYMGLGGYPNKVLGKGLLMLSGGIDSPVSGYLAMKRGVHVDCVYFEAIPHTSLEARNKVIKLCQKLVQYTDEINLYIVPFTKIQEAIYQNVEHTYTITIMRRMMYRIMEDLAKKYKAHVIINGESIGQVASQTLTSMEVINNVTNIPVIRPVCCLDKLEIIAFAKKIDTYDISILPYEDCCTVFVPRHPIINPQLNKCLAYEQSFNYLDMIKETVDNIQVIKVNNAYNDKYSDLL